MPGVFEVWAASGYLKGMMDLLYDRALLFSVLMIATKYCWVCIIIRLAVETCFWFLLALTLFFFLTSYVLFSGKIRACGCFWRLYPAYARSNIYERPCFTAACIDHFVIQAGI